MTHLEPTPLPLIRRTSSVPRSSGRSTPTTARSGLYSRITSSPRAAVVAQPSTSKPRRSSSTASPSRSASCCSTSTSDGLPAASSTFPPSAAGWPNSQVPTTGQRKREGLTEGLDPGDSAADHQRVDVGGPLVGDDRLEVVHVADHRI